MNLHKPLLNLDRSLCSGSQFHGLFSDNLEFVWSSFETYVNTAINLIFPSFMQLLSLKFLYSVKFS